MKKLPLIALLSVFIFFSCGNKSAKTSDAQSSDSLKLSYARGFSVKYFPGYKEVIVFSPWIKGGVYARYYLVKDVKTKTPKDGIKVLVPLKTIAATSVTHFEFLSLLGEINTITGVCSPKIIYNKVINQRVGEGKITDLGDAFSLNVERTLELKSGAVMMSGYNQNDPAAQRISEAGIPVIINNEWMETSLLARAEWIKFVAAFYDKQQLADSIFAGVDKRYNEVKAKAAGVKTKPNVMAGSNFRGTWYMPAGHSFMGRLFADAGARYYYANDTTTGSLPLNVESVLKNFSQTDVWLNCSFNSIADLLKADPKHGLFRPVVLKQVYNFNKRLLPSSANDFWESAVAQPDLLLSDVIAILHPEIMPGYQLVYAQKLQ
ncbi:MAG: ABC transporter substrate-binding protein [Paludibacter sp.]|nr:ABC transporter substrate-binding protein [Paludibacter sp.]